MSSFKFTCKIVMKMIIKKSSLKRDMKIFIIKIEYQQLLAPYIYHSILAVGIRSGWDRTKLFLYRYYLIWRWINHLKAPLLGSEIIVNGVFWVDFEKQTGRQLKKNPHNSEGVKVKGHSREISQCEIYTLP